MLLRRVYTLFRYNRWKPSIDFIDMIISAVVSIIFIQLDYNAFIQGIFVCSVLPHPYIVARTLGDYLTTIGAYIADISTQSLYLQYTHVTFESAFEEHKANPSDHHLRSNYVTAHTNLKRTKLEMDRLFYERAY